MIHFSQSQLLLAKTNEDRTISRKALLHINLQAILPHQGCDDGALMRELQEVPFQTFDLQIFDLFRKELMMKLRKRFHLKKIKKTYYQ